MSDNRCLFESSPDGRSGPVRCGVQGCPVYRYIVGDGWVLDMDPPDGACKEERERERRIEDKWILWALVATLVIVGIIVGIAL